MNVKKKYINKNKDQAGISHYFFNPDSAIYAFGIFLFFVFFMGGGARDDIQSLIVLRPLAAMFMAYALIYKIQADRKWQSFPLMLLSLLSVLMIIQLIPLPPELWMKLPQREIYADIADIAGIEQPWRPISLSPSKTWNSLFSLLIPFAAMTLFMNISAKDRKKALLIIILLLAISAAWGVMQTLGSSRGPLYLYRITNNGIAVGLFSNRNHQSLMLAVLILLLGWYSFRIQKEKLNPLKISLTLGGVVLLIPLIFITGSRAGLILMIPALLGTLYFFYTAWQPNQNKQMQRSHKSQTLSDILNKNSRIIILIMMVIVISLLVFSSIIFSRSLAFDRLFADGGIEELRLKVAPILLLMLGDYMPFGSGFGSFEHVYKIYEPTAFLKPTYFNQAHNDWLQILIEGGVAAFLIVATFIIWLVRQCLLIFRSWKQLGYNRNTLLMCIVFIILVAAASIGDYPLRVPIIMAITAVVICYFDGKVIEIKNLM